MGHPVGNIYISYYRRHMKYSDSEIRTHDGALQDDFSEENWSWDDSGTIFSET